MKINILFVYFKESGLILLHFWLFTEDFSI